MIITKPQLAQAIIQTLYVPLMYLPSGDEKVAVRTEPSIEQCKEAITLEVWRLLKELELEIEPPDLNDPEAIRKFIEDLSRRDFAVSYVI